VSAVAEPLDEHAPDGLDDSVLDLSTSKVEIEVQEALSAKGYNTTATWLEEGAVSVVDDAEQSVLKTSAGEPCQLQQTSEIQVSTSSP
jgi:hypothetical protein